MMTVLGCNQAMDNLQKSQGNIRRLWKTMNSSNQSRRTDQKDQNATSCPLRMIALAAISILAMLLALFPTSPALAGEPANPVPVTVDGKDIRKAAKNRNGLPYKGFGVLSGNSTSALLMDYKAKHPNQYWELLSTLYGGEHPLFTAVKIEMGNDLNTSTGPEASTMRRRNEYPNVQREPGFQLAADAKKVASDPEGVHVSILRWTTPDWVNNQDDQQYIWFKNTVLAVYREYGYMVNEINPDTNETRNPNTNLYKSFSAKIRHDTAGYESTSTTDPNSGFKSAQERNLFHGIRTVAGDTVGKLNQETANQLTDPNDPSLRDAVDVVGTHYNPGDSNGKLTQFAEQYDKEVWNSEGQSTFGDSANRPYNTMDPSTGEGGNGSSDGTGIGGKISALEMANWAVTGFDHARRTANIWQPAIGSFYDGFQYSYKQLLNATDPWSGWIRYDGGLAVLAQFSKFAKTGWESQDGAADSKGIWRAIPSASHSELGDTNPPSGSREGKQSYMTLAAPDASDFSTVIVNDSQYTRTYQITIKNIDTLNGHPLEVWSTQAADKTSHQAYNTNYVRPQEEVEADRNGTYTVTVQPWSIATATSLDYASKSKGTGKLQARSGHGNQIPTVDESKRQVLDTNETGEDTNEPKDGYLYADNFDYQHLGKEVTWDKTTQSTRKTDEDLLDTRGNKAKPVGTPDVAREDRGATPLYTNDTNGAFESVTSSDPGHGRVLRQARLNSLGGAWNAGDPITTIGDVRWANYQVDVDVKFANNSDYALVGARESGGSANGQDIASPELRVQANGQWEMRRLGKVIASGQASSTPAAKFQSGSGKWNSLSVRVAGTDYTCLLNGVEIARYHDSAAKRNGRIQLGSNYAAVEFDNLKVRTLPGYTPYFSNLIDGEHMASLADVSDPQLQYQAGAWHHSNTEGMFTYDRTSSKTITDNAKLTYSFTGTGIDVIGQNDGKTSLTVQIDGKTIARNAPTQPAGSLSTTYSLRGLGRGKHTIVLTADRKGFMVDAIAVVNTEIKWPNTDDSSTDSSKALAELKKATDGAAPLDQTEYEPTSWQVLEANLMQGKTALQDPSEYGLDVEGAQSLASRIDTATHDLVPKDISADVKNLGTFPVQKGLSLPNQLDFDNTQAKVRYDDEAVAKVESTDEMETVTVTGRTTDKIKGVYQRFTVQFLVVPQNLRYFIDSGSDPSARNSIFTKVSAAETNLFNKSSDYQWDGTTPDSSWGYSTTSSTRQSGDPMDWTSSYLGVDYNKPIIYHLSLPAGSYRLSAVQTPRPNCTTEIYSELKAPGIDPSRKTATARGQATTITQTVTLAEPGVVELEFGTNGTSGYNARLGLVYVTQVPRDIGFQGVTTVEGDLPDTVTYDNSSHHVTWDSQSLAQQRQLYSPMIVNGLVSSSASSKQGQSYPVTAHFEVLPDKDMFYYIDSGTNGTPSPQYTVVKNSATNLINDQVDRVSDAPDQWGYVKTGMKVKGGTDINDKYSTGLYQDTTKLIYRLPLKAGTYTLTAGFTEWWNMNRTMNHTVSVNGKELARGNLPLSGNNPHLSSDLTFTLEADSTVEYLVTNEGAGSEKPVISWLAVAGKEGQPAPTTNKDALNAAVQKAKGLQEEDYTPASWLHLSAALDEGLRILNDPNASQESIDSATETLTEGIGSLVAVSQPEPNPGDQDKHHDSSKTNEENSTGANHRNRSNNDQEVRGKLSNTGASVLLPIALAASAIGIGLALLETTRRHKRDGCA